MYACVLCLTPSPTLYHHLTSKSSTSALKLTRCSKCQHEVDHYIEHEALLIGIDLVLLRFPAYRHLYFNHNRFSSFRIHGEDYNGNFIYNANTRKAFISVLVASFLDAYHKFEAIKIRSSTMHQDVNYSPSYIFLHLTVTSFFEHALFVCSIVSYSYFAYLARHRKNKSYPVDCDFLISKLFLAVLLPTSFRFISIFILIWENSDSVRILASFFVLLFQFTSIQTIMEQQYHSLQNKICSDNISRRNVLEQLAPGSSSFLCGMLIRSLVPFLLTDLILYKCKCCWDITQCSGYEILIPSLAGNVGEWRSLCIT